MTALEGWVRLVGTDLRDAERNATRHVLMEAVGLPGFPFRQFLIFKCALPGWHWDRKRGRIKVTTLIFLELGHDAL